MEGLFGMERTGGLDGLDGFGQGQPPDLDPKLNDT